MKLPITDERSKLEQFIDSGDMDGMYHTFNEIIRVAARNPVHDKQNGLGCRWYAFNKYGLSVPHNFSQLYYELPAGFKEIDYSQLDAHDLVVYFTHNQQIVGLPKAIPFHTARWIGNDKVIQKLAEYDIVMSPYQLIPATWGSEMKFYSLDRNLLMG